ncbi:hypothetical protein ABIF38_004402 [Bradyrhizobium japonicum]
MGKAHVAGIGRQLLRHLAIGQPLVAALAPPRAEMDLVDRHRRAQRIGAIRRRARMRDPALVDHDRGGLRAHLGGERQGIGLQRQMLAVAPDDLELVVVADPCTRDEQFPVARAAHAHRMAPSVPEIEVADHADPARIRRQHHEADTVDTVERHRMRAERVVDALMRALAEQIEIEIAQDRRKPVGILQLDDVVAEAGAELVARRAVRQGTCEQAGVMDPRQRRRLAMLADRLDIAGIGQEGAHDVAVPLGVKPEIVEGVGVAALDDGIGLGGQFAHATSCGCCARILSRPVSGTRSQSGRLASSYSIS